jgi:hypothetical protein
LAKRQASKPVEQPDVGRHLDRINHATAHWITFPMGWRPLGRVSIDRHALGDRIRARLADKRKIAARDVSAEAVDAKTAELINELRAAAADFGVPRPGPRRPDRHRREVKRFTEALRQLLSFAWELDLAGAPTKFNRIDVRREFTRAVADATCIRESAAVTYAEFAAAHESFAQRLGPAAETFFRRRNTARMTDRLLACEILAEYFQTSVKSIRNALPKTK